MMYIRESIFSELGKGIFTEQTKNQYLKIIDELLKKGVQGIILACTEIPLLITINDVSMQIFNTIQLHADAGVRFALGK